MANENIQELKFQVGEAWKGVYSSSSAYGLANVVQDATGLSIYRSLKSGNVGHPVSDRTWWFCIIDMSSIKDESDRIAALNQAIAQDEALRVAAEELRQQHEAARIAAETQRNESEQARISAEQDRVNAESARATAEQRRITAEQGRVSAESARVTAEQARVLAETLRANAEDQRAANEQNRVAAEQQRIERADQDHQRAESDHATYVDSLGAFDISAYHATGGVMAEYADLTAALGTNGANIPEAIRKGGMSVKFVLSSDNKYIQYFCNSQTFTTDVTAWERMNLEEEVTGLKTLLGTDAIDKSSSILSWNTGIINKDSKLPDASYSAFCYAIIDVQKGDLIIKNDIDILPLIAAAVSLVSGSGTTADPYIFTPVLYFDTDYLGYRYAVETSGKIAIQARYPNQSQQISWFSVAAQIVKGQIADNSIGTNNIIDKSIISNKIADNAITSDKIADNVLNELPRFSFGYDAFVNSVIKEIYFTPSSLAHYASWSDLYIVLTRKDFGNDHQYGIGLSPDETTTTYEWFWSLNSDHSICGNTTYGVYIVVDWTKVPSNQENYVGRHHKIDIAKTKIGDYSPAILNHLNDAAITISAMNVQTNTNFANLCQTIGTTPMATWVDDDGVIDGEGGKNIQTIVVPTSESIGIPVTLGIICDDSHPLSTTVNVGGVTMTKAEYLLTLQKKGFHITSHPHHEGWYGSHYDLSVVEPKLVENLTMLLLSGFMHPDLLIYPGSSNTYPDVVEIVRKWCVCGVVAGYGTPNHLGDSTKWQIKRTFINFENYYDLHHNDSGFVSAMAWYKEQVDSAFDNGDWIIFGTHCYQFTTSMDTTNPNANTLGNLQELFQYAKNKGVQFRTLWDAYNRRKYLFDFNEINQ